MALLILSVLLGSAVAVLFGATVPGSVFAVLALSLVFAVGAEIVAAAARVALQRRAAEQLKKKLADAVQQQGGFGTYL